MRGKRVDVATILIVEDDFIVAMELQYRLRDLGHTVCGVASSGADAVKKATELRPELVLMDIKLRGDMDGVEAARQIRTGVDIAIVFLTAYSDRNTLQRVQAADSYGFIVKPFGEDELRTTIDSALERHRAGQDGAA